MQVHFLRDNYALYFDGSSSHMQPSSAAPFNTPVHAHTRTHTKLYSYKNKNL